MRATVLATLVCAALALALAWVLGLSSNAPIAVGLLGGTLLGGALGLGGAAWQRSLLVRRPQFAVHSVAAGMLAKLVVIGVALVALTQVPALQARVEPASFILSFLAVVLAVGAFGTQDAVRVLRSDPTASAVAVTRRPDPSSAP